MPNLGPTELLIIAGVLVLLFGATKLPKLARSMGESARIFKAETKGIRDDDNAEGERDDTAEHSGAADRSRHSRSEANVQPRQLPESAQHDLLDSETVDEHQRRKSS